MVDRAIRREGSLRQERRPVPLDFVSVMAYRWRRELKSLALFGKTDQHRRIRPTHAALQLSCGNWTSKLGDFGDVIHRTPEDVNGPQYGEVVGYMARPRIIAT
jgi:hypothetical protein